MASTTTKSITREKNEVVEDLFRFCIDYLYGIKTSTSWKRSLVDRAKSTYFILPGPRVYYYNMIKHVASLGMIKPTVRDFEKFWFELSDLHKDRYLLVNYMVVFDHCNREEADERGILATPTAVALDDLWIESFAQFSHVIRGFVMEKNKNKFRRDGALSLFQNAYSIEDMWEVLQLQLSQIRRSFAQRINTMQQGHGGWRVPRALSAEVDQCLIGWIRNLIEHVFAGFVNTYFAWVSFDMQNLRRYSRELERTGEQGLLEYLDGDSILNEQIDFMRKLKLAAPRWSESNRRMMLEAIETGGKSCRGTYVQILLHEVGAEKFKKLVFGKQHFCAHCRRSSYIGDDRMLACKRCDTEGIRPRAWYCNRECQKANWRQHRANKHPTIVVEKETSVHPAVVEEKKSGKKKKRKPRKK